MIELLRASDFDAVFSIMEESFPKDEYRTREGQMALLEEKAYRVYGVRGEGGDILAFLALWELDEYTFLEHFAVSRFCRNSGLGTKVLSELIELSEKPLCLEVEIPENELARRRLGFYSRNGFFLNEYSYFQPSLAKDRAKVPLYIMTYGREVDEKEFLRIKNALYTQVYKV